VLTDNAKSYRDSRDWTAVCQALQIKRRFIKPRCPWTNGKAERFNRTLQNEWAYATAWTSKQCRTHRGLDRVPRALQHSTRPLRCRRTPADQPTRRLNTVNNVHGTDS
jgi:transposase InsO family protein